MIATTFSAKRGVHVFPVRSKRKRKSYDCPLSFSFHYANLEGIFGFMVYLPHANTWVTSRCKEDGPNRMLWMTELLQNLSTSYAVWVELWLLPYWNIWGALGWTITSNKTKEFADIVQKAEFGFHHLSLTFTGMLKNGSSLSIGAWCSTSPPP